MYNLSAHPTVKTNAFACYVSPGPFENIQNLWIISKLHTDLFQDRFCIVFYQFRTFVTENVEFTDAALYVGGAGFFWS